MFNEILTFLQVVKHGSFSRAAQNLFLTPNAIKKRIHSLEEETGILLFDRTNKGVFLTEAGKSLYKDFSAIDQQYQKALERAAAIQNQSEHGISVGVMNTFSDTFTVSNWHEIPRKFQHSSVHLVYYGDSLYDLHELFTDVGTKTDLCIDIYDADVAEKHGLRAQKISEYPLYIGIPGNVPVEHDMPVTLDMMRGQTLALLQPGRAAVFDILHDKIAQSYSEIRIDKIENYSIRTFHSCYEHDKNIIVAKNQTDLYPFYSFHRLEPEIMVAFGIYFSPDRKSQVKEFVAKIMI